MADLDLLIIEPDSSTEAYQALKDRYSAIEPPTWALLLAESCRSVGHTVQILDCVAEGLSDEKYVERIKTLKPRLILFTLYGQNPNSSTTSMIGATRLAGKLVKKNGCGLIAFVGNHVSALPKDVLNKHAMVDIVFLNEGVYALRNLLACPEFTYEFLANVNGI